MAPLGDEEPAAAPPRFGLNRRSAPILLAAPALTLLLVALVVGIGGLVQPPPGGPLVATLDIKTGEAFELTYVSDGNPQRVWLDMRCEQCSLPVNGTIAVAVAGKQLKSLEISSGDAESLTDDAWLIGVPLTAIPESPTGSVVAVSGVLSVTGPRGALSRNVGVGKLPRVSRFLLSIAP